MEAATRARDATAAVNVACADGMAPRVPAREHDGGGRALQMGAAEADGAWRRHVWARGADVSARGDR